MLGAFCTDRTGITIPCFWNPRLPRGPLCGQGFAAKQQGEFPPRHLRANAYQRKCDDPQNSKNDRRRKFFAAIGAYEMHQDTQRGPDREGNTQKVKRLGESRYPVMACTTLTSSPISHETGSYRCMPGVPRDPFFELSVRTRQSRAAPQPTSAENFGL